LRGFGPNEDKTEEKLDTNWKGEKHRDLASQFLFKKLSPRLN